MLNLLIAFLLSKAGLAQSYLKEELVLPEVLSEISGMAFDKDGHLWMINDSGNPSEVFILLKGTDSIIQIPVQAKNVDWEALTFDHEGNLLIADIGNNCNCRTDLGIYKIKNPSIHVDTLKAEFHTFYYPEQIEFPASEPRRNYDAESLIYFRNKWYIFTKCRRKPFDGVSLVYELDPSELNQPATLVDSLTFPAEKMEESWISDAAISAHDQLVLLGYRNLHIISHFSRNKFSSGILQEFDFHNFSQTEGVAFVDDSTLLISNEIRPPFDGGKLYSADIRPFQTAIEGITKSEVSLTSKIISQEIAIELNLRREAPVYFEIINQNGKAIKGGKIGEFTRGKSTCRIPVDELMNAQYIFNVVVGTRPHGFFITINNPQSN